MVKMLGAMLEGSLVSLEIFFLTLLFALPLALPVAFGRMSARLAMRLDRLKKAATAPMSQMSASL